MADHVEWSTLFLIAVSLSGWLGAGLIWQTNLWWLSLPVMAVLATLYASLQHETIHGHPTRFAWLNEAMVSLPLGVLFPYRRYRDLHLKHHNDSNLTDPFEDPESYFWPLSHYNMMRPFMRRVFQFNNTFVGRLLIGPVLTIIGFSRTEWARLRAAEPGVRVAWLMHTAGLVLLFAIVIQLFAMPVWVYIVGVVYPAASLTAMRAYAEHQAAENIGGRSAIVETNALFSLLYLNNNLHIVHHAHPQLPWYDLPALYRERKHNYLAANDHLLFKGYGDIALRFAFTVKQPVDHPFLHRDDQVAG
ncbi:MAG: fatty acid desaturase [Ahrensia sp.]|nr:fatty acid desaturase [Ahrensia sp.]